MACRLYGYLVIFRFPACIHPLSDRRKLDMGQFLIAHLTNQSKHEGFLTYKKQNNTQSGVDLELEANTINGCQARENLTNCVIALSAFAVFGQTEAFDFGLQKLKTPL